MKTPSWQKFGMLLRSWLLVTDEQLNDALIRQQSHGARLGTNLVELGSVSLETVAGLLALQTGIPKATLPLLERVTSETLALVPKALVEEHHILPLRMKGTVLDLAFIDPPSTETRSRLANALGLSINPLIVPELRFHAFLERHYGVPPHERFHSLLARKTPQQRRKRYTELVERGRLTLPKLTDEDT